MAAISKTTLSNAISYPAYGQAYWYFFRVDNKLIGKMQISQIQVQLWFKRLGSNGVSISTTVTCKIKRGYNHCAYIWYTLSFLSAFNFCGNHYACMSHISFGIIEMVVSTAHLASLWILGCNHFSHYWFLETGVNLLFANLKVVTFNPKYSRKIYSFQSMKSKVKFNKRFQTVIVVACCDGKYIFYRNHRSHINWNAITQALPCNCYAILQCLKIQYLLMQNDMLGRFWLIIFCWEIIKF